ncbi:hypothetical protein [Mucilaginibacter ginkgonis]|uniref:Uncharacterized protein n=1 Tax=Mucilaginibacter ginkgonis TaxID=2682091 RepID=A0A6I4I202_9SPHI|nr:hypothetical protein [Mucilaginibacter ginkgonis]QQL48423.1 hypothetical protein GO620_009475 [Mucilaginibacter ginkgonis]
MMKRAAAILLLLVTLYNLGGYLLAFQLVIYHSNKLAEQQISSNKYNEADLVEIKIPVRLPGIDSWRGYQNVSGTVELEKGAYNYVRMKMSTDTIYVMCVPNYKTTRLLKANVICAKEVSDAPFNEKKQNIPVKSVNLLIDGIAQRLTISLPQQEIFIQKLPATNAKLLAGVLNTAARPPEGFLS